MALIHSYIPTVCGCFLVGEQLTTSGGTGQVSVIRSFHAPLFKICGVISKFTVNNTSPDIDEYFEGPIQLRMLRQFSNYPSQQSNEPYSTESFIHVKRVFTMRAMSIFDSEHQYVKFEICVTRSHRYVLLNFMTFQAILFVFVRITSNRIGVAENPRNNMLSVVDMEGTVKFTRDVKNTEFINNRGSQHAHLYSFTIVTACYKGTYYKEAALSNFFFICRFVSTSWKIFLMPEESALLKVHGIVWGVYYAVNDNLVNPETLDQRDHRKIQLALYLDGAGPLSCKLHDSITDTFPQNIFSPRFKRRRTQHDD